MTVVVDLPGGGAGTPAPAHWRRRIANLSLAIGLLVVAAGWLTYRQTHEHVRIIKVRWSQAPSGARRARLQQDLALRGCRLESDSSPTEICELLAWTPEILTRIVQSPAIEDTSGFNRRTLAFPAQPRQGPRHTWWLYRQRAFRNPNVLNGVGASVAGLLLLGLLLQPVTARVASRGSSGFAAAVLRLRRWLTRPLSVGWMSGALAAAVASPPLFVHAYSGAFNRFLADDYCSALAVASLGVFRMMVKQYLDWSGRYTAHALDGFVTQFGPVASGVQPTAALTLIVAGLTVYFGRELAGDLNRRARIAAGLALAVLVTTTVFYVTPDPLESLYWGQGMRTALPAVAMGIALAVLLARTSPSRSRHAHGWTVACAALAFLSCGVGETSAAVQTTTLALLGMYRLTQRSQYDRRDLIRLGGAFAASVAGALIVVAAPGNAVRESFFAHPHTVSALLRIATDAATDFLKLVFVTNARSIAGVFAAGAALALAQRRAASPKGAATTLAWLTASTAVVLVAIFLPAAYGLSGAPPPRTQVTPTFVVFIFAVLAGHQSGTMIRATLWFSPGVTRLAVALAAVLLVMNTQTFTLYARTRGATLVEESVAWDRTDRYIRRQRAAGAKTVRIPRVRDNWAGLETVGSDASFWVNSCVSGYYGVTVVAR